MRPRLHRRLPLYGRPLQFAGGVLAVVLGLIHGPNWSWDWDLQTGNIFILILVPSKLFVFSGLHALWLGVGVAGLLFLGFLAFGPRPAPDARPPRGWAAFVQPSFRFYPLTLALGLFLTYFGVFYFFDATVAADRAPGGFVTFVYLNYAGILQRPILSLIGLSLLTAGLLLSTFLAVSPGTRASRYQTVMAPVARAIPVTIVPAKPMIAPSTPPRPATPSLYVAPSPAAAARPAPRPATPPPIRASPTMVTPTVPAPNVGSAPRSGAPPQTRAPSTKPTRSGASPGPRRTGRAVPATRSPAGSTSRRLERI